MRRVIAVLATAAGLAVGCGAALAADAPPGWSWLLGHDLDLATIGQRSDDGSVYIGAYYGGSVPVELSGAEIVDTDTYGYFEFEHSAASPGSTFVAATPDGRSTPIKIGKADGQDVTPLIVSGNATVTGELQSWTLGGAASTGIDGSGRLRLNEIALRPVVSRGTVRLEAVLPDGSVQLLVPVRPPR